MTAMAPAMIAPGMPHLLMYGLSMFGSFCRRSTKDVHCRAYEITAANTAMFRTAATTCAPLPCRCRYHTMRMTAYPTIAPAINATWGVLRSPWGTDSHFGKQPARDNEYVCRPYA